MSTSQEPLTHSVFRENTIETVWADNYKDKGIIKGHMAVHDQLEM